MELVITNAFEKFSFIVNFLLKQTIYTLILFVIIFIAAFFLRKKPPLWHFGLWLLVLIRLILPTDLSLPISGRNFFTDIPLMNKVTASMESVTSKLDIDRIRNAGPTFSNALWIQGITSTSAEVFNQRENKYITWSAIFVFAWITGCLLMIVLVLKKLLGYRRIIRNSSSVQDKRLLSFLMDWQHRLKIRRTVRIVSSDEFLSPFTTGIIRPVIYIPGDFLNSTDTDTIHSIIAHEMVHIKRFDALWIKLQNILQIIYFFNPAVWYANRQISLAREQISDSIVLARGTIPLKAYGNSIIQVLKHNLFGLDFADLLPCFGSHKKVYKQRIKNIVKENAMKKKNSAFIFSVISIFSLLIFPLVSSCNNEIKFEVPIYGVITSMFGWRPSPFTGKREFHTGIDIAAPKGTPIIASASGTVTKAGWEGDYGNLVILKHSNDYSTYYGKCDTILVKEGQTVKSGDTIATCGRTGLATGNHLHFEIRKDGEAVNPYPYLFPRTNISRSKN